MYVLPKGENPNLRLFLKSRNLKMFAMSPNTHSAPTLALLMTVLYAVSVDLIKGYLMKFVVVVVVDRRGPRINTTDFQFD